MRPTPGSCKMPVRNTKCSRDLSIPRPVRKTKPEHRGAPLDSVSTLTSALLLFFCLFFFFWGLLAARLFRDHQRRPLNYQNNKVSLFAAVRLFKISSFHGTLELHTSSIRWQVTQPTVTRLRTGATQSGQLCSQLLA